MTFTINDFIERYSFQTNIEKLFNFLKVKTIYNLTKLIFKQKMNRPPSLNPFNLKVTTQ